MCVCVCVCVCVCPVFLLICALQHAGVMRACFVLEQEQRASMEDVCRMLGVQ